MLGILLKAMLLDSIAEVVHGNTKDYSILRQDQPVPSQEPMPPHKVGP